MAGVPSSRREQATELVRQLRRRGHQAYWVGGCVRDLEMGREPHDYDIATDALPSRLLEYFPGALSVGARFGVVVVPRDGHHFEISTFRAEGPYLDGRRPSVVEFVDARTDVQRRDFTVNGLLHDPLTGTTIDYVGGREDIARRLVRAIGDPQQRFREDRLRMLRAVRLACELGFEIEPATFAAIRAEADAVLQVSAERIRDELLRILVSPQRGRGLRLLQESGLLRAILPEVEATVGVAQPEEFHPEGDVFTHTVLVLEHLRDPHPVLAVAALLHDVGKPSTLVRGDRIRFHGHAEVGARLAEAIGRRLRLPGDDVDRIVALVADHLRVKDLPKMRPARAARFLLRADAPDHLELHRADCLGSHGDLSVYEWAVAAREAYLRTPPPAAPLLTGDDLIAMGYRPGPRFREMLEAVRDGQLEGTLRSAADARAFLLRTYGPGEGSSTPEGKPIGRGDRSA
ncbi:MAG: CCA tRNA nucleotidyltransferase [Armatimonadota bacterium]|nr:CCA tRNA nucleotidyltransferase [Armatimonadota bacterium]MDR7451904.1 CCA tRNA nucleotidyltransferase [Armatimonadota bacterium]MDR7466586.1 CCA tRNA nucleotidyltransferase [Armatimonadota bacterium]MDR7495092.1 CCA tRNA nucleotidyltransferase [Armatimonadota bacterium]MDR7500166.1 CCA tRNA nucleotidyltransferase [Armatimonadota bacterium]